MAKGVDLVYLVARYADKEDPENKVYFVKKDLRVHPPLLFCDCDEFLVNVIEIDKNGQSASISAVCRHTKHATDHCLHEGVGVLLHGSVPDQVIHSKDPRQQLWWVERNVQQFII
jgi:hypothetical protein